MEDMNLKYKDRIFVSIEQLSETLLHEINEQILYIDMGEKKNTHDQRNQAKFLLMHLQRAYKGTVPTQYRSTYNSLWSQLYRLEHQDEFKHPYLKTLFDKIHVIREHI
ncbi:hypothetical protein [Bacillus solimangrovi]|uniref:Uncharacterized protein n=1 Tax=Bacillus solimangrovi TaxID=1305675 RepID=A0A1E5LFF6_9BACI|nr:hypothetical protein [Bacillus solimangrovi]OEH92804.1 hypothetical protein BFG57_02080 [Bacillus solimangrovi]